MRHMRVSALHRATLLRRLGWAGVLPQLVLVVMIASGAPSLHWAAVASATLYAALILSFIGGIWWGIALLCPGAPRWTPVAAISANIIGLGAVLPWVFGLPWPRPSLIMLGLAILASPIVDRAVMAEAEPIPDWLRLRAWLSVSLGAATIAAALV